MNDIIPNSNSVVRLRAIEPQDLDLIWKWENSPKIWTVSNTLVPFSRYIIEQYIIASQNQDIFAAKQVRLMIESVNPKQAVGMLDLFDYEPLHRRAGIGILIDEKVQSKGYASAALEVVIDYAFHTLQLHQLYAHVAADNEASLHLFKKCGFSIAGCKKEWLFQNRQWVDEYILQRIYDGK